MSTKNRITTTDLISLINRINKITKSPATAYERTDKGFIPQAGCYHLSQAYGGYALHRMLASSGVTDVFGCGHVPKRDLYDRMYAFICGVEASMDGNIRAAYWTDGSADVLLTSEEDSHKTDEELIELATKFAAEIGLEMGDGRIVVGNYKV